VFKNNSRLEFTFQLRQIHVNKHFRPFRVIHFLSRMFECSIMGRLSEKWALREMTKKIAHSKIRDPNPKTQKPEKKLDTKQKTIKLKN